MKRLTTKEFINRCNLTHNYKWCYDRTNYVGSKDKVIVTCTKHGDFLVGAAKHLHDKVGCKQCYIDNMKNTLKKSNSVFINELISVFGDRYGLNEVNYVNNKTKVILVCTKHGDFKIRPTSALLGVGCRECYLDNFNPYKSKKNELSLNFNSECNLIHNNKYDYSLVDYNYAHTKVKIICPKHGVFEQTPNAHLKGQGCPMCKESKGEKKIRRLLTENNINFVSQHTFNDCKYIHTLPFDFYLPEHNICIEYQGEQHYKSFNYFGGVDEFNKRKKRDKIKIDYCKKNNISLIIIKYNNNINDVLSNCLITKTIVNR